MAAVLIARLNFAFRRLERVLANALGQKYPPDSYALAGFEDFAPNNALQNQESHGNHKSFSLSDLLGDGLLWAAPRNRRTIERRLKRKFGHPDYVYKLYKPKTNILVCNACGHYQEAGILCSHCYEKIRMETEAMQASIEAELGLDQVNSEVIVLYEGERSKQPEEFWEGKRIVEIKKPRPVWFSRNLLEQSTSTPGTSSNLKPSELA